MGEALHSAWHGGAAPAPSASWWWHRQLKKPLFGSFMRPWRWPAGVSRDGWSSHSIASGSHSTLSAIVKRTEVTGPRGVVVCAHPMGLAAKGFWLKQGHAEALLQAGFHVVAFDFNGFGESPSTNFDYPEDVLAVGRFARAAFPGLAVHALGASFGAMNTLSALARPGFPFDRVVAEGCASSLAMFWKAYPVANTLLRVASFVDPGTERALRPEAAIAHLPKDVRLLLVHSRSDPWTDVANGDRLAAAAPAGAVLQRLVLERAAHTHGLRDEAGIYLPAVLNFLASS